LRKGRCNRLIEAHHRFAAGICRFHELYPLLEASRGKQPLNLADHLRASELSPNEIVSPNCFAEILPKLELKGSQRHVTAVLGAVEPIAWEATIE
jgi:hypothetical protein